MIKTAKKVGKNLKTITLPPGRNAVLVFSLPDDDYDYELAMKAGDCYSALNEIYDKCRNLLKYGEFKTIKEAHAFVEEIRQLSAIILP